jgi:hypothetical protein
MQMRRRKRLRPLRAANLDAMSEKRRERLALAQALRARRLEREVLVRSYLNRRAERHTVEKLAEAWASFPDELLPTAFEKVSTGEAEPPLVRALLGQWADTLVHQPCPPGVSEAEHRFWLDALRAIAEGADANKALHLKIGHRRPGKERDLLAARDAWWLIHHDNVAAEQAFATVAGPLAVTPERVQDLYYQYRAALDTYFSRR